MGDTKGGNNRARERDRERGENTSGTKYTHHRKTGANGRNRVSVLLRSSALRLIRPHVRWEDSGAHDEPVCAVIALIKRLRLSAGRKKGDGEENSP